MAQLLGFGTGTVNFFGRYAYVGEGKGGFDAVAWTEQDEPQAASAAICSSSPIRTITGATSARTTAILKEAYHHDGEDILDLACAANISTPPTGPGGFEVFDVANIDNKGFSERITTAPGLAAGPAHLCPDQIRHERHAAQHPRRSIPLRTHRPENEEQPISPVYGYVFVTDRDEGLVMVNVGTLLDGDPTNNFFRDTEIIRFNPGGRA